MTLPDDCTRAEAISDSARAEIEQLLQKRRSVSLQTGCCRRAGSPLAEAEFAQ